MFYVSILFYILYSSDFFGTSFIMVADVCHKFFAPGRRNCFSDRSASPVPSRIFIQSFKIFAAVSQVAFEHESLPLAKRLHE